MLIHQYFYAYLYTYRKYLWYMRRFICSKSDGTGWNGIS